MAPIVYFIIGLLFFVYFVWVWKSSREFDNIIIRMILLIIGTLFSVLLTYVLFIISKIGLDYPKEEMIRYIRNIILLVFVPINGFAIIPQFVNLCSRIKNGSISDEEKKRKIRILVVVFILLMILECFYFKNIQNGMLNYMKLKM